MVKSKKIRRHSGRYTPRRAGKIKISEMIINAEEPTESYDNWDNYRDGIRINKDRTKLRNLRVNYGMEKEKIKKENNKIKRNILIRKAKKEGIFSFF